MSLNISRTSCRKVHGLKGCDSMVIPTHIHWVSIIPLAIGLAILFYNKAASTWWGDFAGKRFAEYYGPKSYFFETQQAMRAWGFYRAQVVFFGFWMVLMAWVISYGPVCIGSAAEADYCQQIANAKDVSATVRPSLQESNQLERMSDVQLREELKKSLANLLAAYDEKLGLQTSAYLREFEYGRKLNDPEIQSEVDAMLKKYGPCWGIPGGQCAE